MIKTVWIVKPIDEERPLVYRFDFGLYTIFPSEDAAKAFLKSPLCGTDSEVVEGLLNTYEK